jgi:hypothetical protein
LCLKFIDLMVSHALNGFAHIKKPP